jgi:hypothetical protein
MPHSPPRLDNLPLTRRELLRRSGLGFGLLGLAGVLADDGLVSFAAASPTNVNPLAPKKPHFPGKAKRVVHLFMNGGPSHVDTFDPKPLLDKYHGKPLPRQNLRTERKTGAAMRSPFKFQKYGKSGIAVSELFARTAAHIDDIAVIRSMHADVPNHEPSLMLMNCGDGRLPRPSMGAWVTYGLGSENQNLPGFIAMCPGGYPIVATQQNLPGFIAMCPGGYPIVATQNWRAAFLPGAYQGTYLNTQFTDVEKLIANIRNHSATPAQQRRQLDLVRRLNELHRRDRPQDARLEARIQTFELAYRMQAEATDAFDVNHEPPAVRTLYGPGVQARQLLIARRLLERGVRFIQVWSGAGQPWDNHDNLATAHRQLAASWDRPIAAFLTDLKLRGLLDSTLVMWGGEFGRTPVAELPALSGRDHNHYGFSMWLAGGGVKGGYVHGATDDFGFQAVEKKVHVHDLHATILDLLGFDHEKLTYRYAGRDFRLTDVHGNVVKELLA